MRNGRIAAIALGLSIVWQSLSAESVTPSWLLPPIKEANGRITAQLGGRLHLDFVRFDNDNRGAGNAGGIQVRRGWVNLVGKIYDFDYRVSVDLADNQVSYKSFYLRRRIGPGRLILGQFKPFFSLDDTISSDNIMLLERAFVATTVAPLFRLGAAYQGRFHQLTYGLTAYSLNDIDGVRSNGSGQAARFTWSPPSAENRLLHLGLSLAKERYSRSNATEQGRAASLTVRPVGAKGDDSRLNLLLFRNGAPTDVIKSALELGTVYGPWSLQGEYANARYDDGIQRAVVTTYYTQLSYALTGESRPYNRNVGRFDGIGPRNKRSGAWDLVWRYDHIDGRQRTLGDLPLSHRAVDAYTLGLTWTYSANLRLMLNFIHSRSRDRLTHSTLDNTNALATRVQLIF